VTLPSRARREFHGQKLARGIAAVEFVICAPFLLLLMLTATEVGRAFIHYQTLTYCVRQGARYLSEHSIDGTTGVVSLEPATIQEARNLAVYGNILGTGSPKLPNFQATQLQIEVAGGGNVRITATYPYEPMLGPVMPTVGFGRGSFALAFNMQTAVTLRAIS
jgi:Flp pilus assembly protein TadG